MQETKLAPARPQIRMTRLARFRTGQLYCIAGRPAGEAEALFGKAAGPEGHGHNYRLLVSATGPVDPATGMVINIKRVDEDIKRRIVEPLDHARIDRVWPEFQTNYPTAENLALAMLRRLPAAWPTEKGNAARLTGVRLYEDDFLYAEVETVKPNIVRLTTSIEFAASHRLNNPAFSAEENRALYGKCNNEHGHGHNYVAEITVAGEVDPQTGTIVHLEQLEKLLKTEIDGQFDHKNLNVDLPYFQDRVASAENIAVTIWNILAPKIERAKLWRVRLYENPRSYFDYRGPDA